MARSYVLYSGNAVQELFSIPFGYLDRDHVVVSVNNVVQVEETDYIFPSASSIDFVVAPAVGVNNVNIARQTPTNTAVVDFEDGVTLLEEDLDNAALQALYALEETLDDFDALDTDALQLDATDTFWDAASKRIQNLASPTASNHAVTKAYADGLVIAEGNVPPPVNPTDDGKILQAAAGAFTWEPKAVTAVQISDSTAAGRALLTAATVAAQRVALDVPTNAEAILDTIIDAKGDLIAGTAADTPARVAIGANRTILEADSAETPGIKWVARALGLKSVQVFTGSGTWTRPTGIRRVIVEVVGGGASGGGCANATAGIAGGGGGGGFVSKLIDVSAIATSTITVGAGGAAPAAGANPGNAGANSVWADGVTTLTAGGGAAGPAPVAGIPGGAGGTAAGGDSNIPGMGGGYPTAAFNTIGNHGGNSHRGAGGAVAGFATIAGLAGQAYGGGGSGALHTGTGGALAGGAGAAGIIIVYEYE